VSNLVSNKYRRGTATNVQFPSLPSLTTQPAMIDLYQKQYQHDILTLEYRSESPLWIDTLKTGTPVSFTWRQETVVKNWIGYVSSIQKVNAPQRTNIMQVVCVGATFPMKQRVTRIFENKTIPQVVQLIAEGFGFSVLTDSHPQVFDQLAITGNSYWEWINEQAKRIGYGVIVDGMNFVFRPLDKLINMTFSNAPVMSLGNAGAPFNTQYLDRTLDQFKIILGDNVEASSNWRAVKNVGGVDPETSELFLSKSSPAEGSDPLRETVSPVLFDEFRTDRVINSRVASDQAALAAAAMARFGIPATIMGQGDPRIRPFGVIYVAGTGVTTDGYWMVTEARHKFHKIGDYMIDLSVSTDGVGDAVVETPFRTRSVDGAGTVNLNEASISGQISSLSFEFSDVALKDYTPINSESLQGYLTSPKRWKSEASNG
jgi:phage protein D